MSAPEIGWQREIMTLLPRGANVQRPCDRPGARKPRTDLTSCEYDRGL
jgi:hypothetical protein